MSKVNVKHKSKNYNLTYTIRDIEAFENITGKSMLPEISVNRGMFPISELRTLFIYGIKDVANGQPVAEEEASNIFDDLLNNSYVSIAEKVLRAISEDCPFLFRET